MPTSPALAEGLAEPILRLYLEAELELLRKVARRVERGLTEPSWAEQKLLEVQYLRREAERQVAGVVGEGRTAVEEAVRTAYNRGVATALSDLARAKVPETQGIGVAWSHTSEATVQALVIETVGRVQATHWRILRAVDDTYRQVISEATSQVIIGSLTRREAAQKALNGLLSRGVSGFIDRAGRNWDLASYVEMAVRTGVGNASVLGYVGKLEAAGEDLVIVSDAPGECPLCRPWEGKVLSISGRSSEHESLGHARAVGLFHAHCRHRTSLYTEGLTRPLTGTADPAGYEARDQQRYLERGVRYWKRRETLALSDEDRQAAQARIRTWQGRLREHVASSDLLRRLYYREQIGAAR